MKNYNDYCNGFLILLFNLMKFLFLYIHVQCSSYINIITELLTILLCYCYFRWNISMLGRIDSTSWQWQFDAVDDIHTFLDVWTELRQYWHQ